ncbi:MAG: ATP-binding protein [Myxococcota bacterium]|nr:ATP-binding protein [Myxococcota bacterium]
MGRPRMPASTSAEATLDALADPVLVRGPDGRVLYVNAAAATLFAETAEALIGREASSLVPERLREVEGEPFFDWLATRYRTMGRPVRVPMLRSDGVEIHQVARVSTSTIGPGQVAVVAVFRPPTEDIDLATDPLQLEYGENPSPESTYQKVFDAVPVGVLHFDARGRVTDCNEVFLEQLGSTRERVLGLDMLTLPNKGVAAAIREATEGRDGYYEGEYTSVTGNRSRYYRALFSPILRDGRVEGGVGVVDDVTDRREIEARLAQGERMASLGRLAAGVVHEINNPLAYVRTSLEVARRAITRFRDDGDASHLDKVLDSVAHAEDGVERVRVIASDLKTFSRGDEGSWLLVDIGRVAKTAINLAHNEIRHRAELVVDIADALPRVLGSETRFVQVLVNLLVNAAHAIEEKGEGTGRIALRIQQEGGELVIEVEDTGAGIPTGPVERIFEPFWTSKPKGVGTGLGLSICHGIVTSAGGDIRVARSTPGEGTTIRVELPAAAGQAMAAVPDVRDTEPDAPAGAGRLLVIDDEVKLAESLAIALGDGFDVKIAGSGREALDILAEDRDWDLVLCDLMMPEVSGMDVYEAIRDRMPQLLPKLVFMTGGAFTTRARDFLKHERPRRLQKPFGLDEIERLLRD